MKKIALLLALVVLFSFSCDKKYKFYAFYIKKTVELKFEPSAPVDFEDLQELNVYIENIYDTEGTSADLIEEITIEEVSLSYDNYDKFNDIELKISADGFNEIQLATNEDVNPYEFIDYVDLALTTDRMDDYIKSLTFNIKTIGQLSSVHAQGFTVGINLRFLVKTYVK